MERGAIYTAITGGKDLLREVKNPIPGVTYICFTDDDKLRSDSWYLLPIEPLHISDPVVIAKVPKILPHRYLRPFAWSLWIDGNMEITGDLEPFITEHLEKGPLVAFRQFQRNCAYQEPEACIRLGKDRPAVLMRQAQRYREAGMPEGLSVPAATILLRRHNDSKVMDVMRLWWNEILRGSRRDQVSLPYVLWKTGTECKFFFDGGPPFWNALPFLKRHPHQIPTVKPKTVPSFERLCLCD